MFIIIHVKNISIHISFAAMLSGKVLPGKNLAYVTLIYLNHASCPNQSMDSLS